MSDAPIPSSEPQRSESSEPARPEPTPTPAPAPASPPAASAPAQRGEGSYLPLLLVLGAALVAAAIGWGMRQDEGETPGSPAAVQRARTLLETARGADAAGSLPALAEAHRLAPEDPETNLALGRALFEVGRPAEALPPLAKARAARPDDAEAHLLAGMAFTLVSRPDDARVAFDRVLALKPGDPQAHYFLAVVAKASDDPEGVLRNLDAMARTGAPEPIAAIQLRLDALQSLGRTADSIAPLTSLVAAAAPRERLFVRRLLQERVVEVHGWSEAAERARAAAAAPDADAATLYLCAHLVAKHPRAAHEARGLLEKALEREPGFPWALGGLAVQMMRDGDLEGARARLTDALQRDPTLAEAELALAMLDEAAGRFDDAVARYQRLLASPRSRTIGSDGVMACLLAAGRDEEALKFVRGLLTPDAPPGHPTRQFEAKVLAQLGRVDELRAVMEAIRAASPNPWRWRGDLGVLLCEAGRPDDARAAFDAALPELPEGEQLAPEVFLWSGICRALTDPDAARALWRRGATTGQEFGGEAMFTWSCRRLLGEATAEDVQAAARIGGVQDRNDAWFVEGLALEMAGDEAEARAAYAKCKEASRGAELPARLVDAALARVGP